MNPIKAIIGIISVALIAYAGITIISALLAM